MAKVLLLSTAPANDPLKPYNRKDFERLQSAVPKDRFGIHSLTDDPYAADLIIFVGSSENYCQDVRRHLYVKKMREKCFLFHGGDNMVPFLPGVYVSTEKRWFSDQRTRTGHYLRVFDNDAITYDMRAERRFLFSFIGSAKNSKVRGKIAALKHPNGFILDTSCSAYHQTDSVQDSNKEFVKRYIETIKESKFVLCPRGIGTSSWRLFETMKAGRVPIIISDQWIPPDGPKWKDFSFRVAEKDIESIPELLEMNEGKALQMGQSAAEQWEEWFSKEVSFHRITEWCLDIKKRRKRPEALMRWTVSPQCLRPFHFRHYLLSEGHRVLRSLYRKS